MSKKTQREVSAFETGRQYGLKIQKESPKYPHQETTRKNRKAKTISKLYKTYWLLGCNAGIRGEVSGKEQKRLKKLELLFTKKKMQRRH